MLRVVKRRRLGFDRGDWTRGELVGELLIATPPQLIQVQDSLVTKLGAHH
jgi:hypothetical protein